MEYTDITQVAETSERRCYIPKIRYVVTLLGMLGCSVDYLVRYGLSVAIVAMVQTPHPSNHTRSTLDACPAALLSRPTENYPTDAPKNGDQFDWSVYEQGIILGTFFWGYFITKSTGGRISELFGAREIMAASLGISGILSILCPFVAHIHPLALAGVRFFMGLVQGPAFPALYYVIAKWAPPDELATMITIAYSGMSVGSLIALGGSGWVINYMGWEWVFYGGGILALLWTPMWLFLVTNDPQKHPLISKKEQELLLVNEAIRPRRYVPWRKLITCWRFYPSILAEVASSWVGNITTTEGPTFLTSKVGLNMKQVSWVLATMQLASSIAGFIFGRISDLLSKHVTSKLNSRRIIHSIATIFISTSLIVIAFVGCNAWAVSAMMVMITVGSSGSLSTYTLTPLDLAPNYAGTLSGLLGIGNISGFIAPIVTNAMLVKTGSWAPSLILASGMYLSTGILYITTTSTTVQDWNYYEDIPSSDEERPEP